MRGNPPPRRRAIQQFSLDNTFIKEWDYVSEAENYYNRMLGLKYKGLISTNIKKNKQAYGYIWKYKK